ncbi:N-acyl-D-amino-acid deacylase family protein [Nocardia seriolae]|uniref:Dihydroorotase n=1 Tax=Nocardia seriolae TaxID=37332 RepID=A0A0B8N2U9_9NOCA|nr:amidohydrolase family protein [Nocardia seriolae]APA96219.1 Dihydroorotase [Nocardia seriolae]MTJ65706.1 amidohydrolase family protein [Nocardia seriolae]MTJ71644.1 amidohydrolase family protein [Nocardia seriolae]MTJ86361.1 amidohydrolase family protein [Nocardia seriolae]MTK30355.1 amidohydrolase family protein [Nocardia seriolae]
MYDTIIKNGRWFDGTGAPSALRNLGIRDGRVATVSAAPLDETDCARVIDATGRWVLPGMIDIHTHYDVEVLLDPTLSESLRHGVTTLVLGSCSLSTVHVAGQDAGDLFGRVEAIPRKHVVAAVDGLKTWNSAHGYVQALESLPLGPNIAAFIGHSDIRTAQLGLRRATDPAVKPSEAELSAMEHKLREALDAGFVGMSSQQLLFDKLDGEVCRSRTLPSTYATAKERRRLNRILRDRKRALQGGPDVARPQSLIAMAAGSLGIFRPELKVSLLSAADIKAIPGVVKIFPLIGKVLNRLGGDFRWQHLPVPFEVYSDGIDLPVFEEFGSGAAALHLSNQLEKRHELFADPEYRRQFRKDYDKKWGPRVWHRDFFDAEITECPDPSVVGKTFGQVGVDRGGIHPVDAFLDLLVEHGSGVRWRTTISNHRPEVLDVLAADPSMQLGFSDAGAHLRNMAFYNFGLRFLKRVHRAQQQGRPFMTVEHAVHRVTGELADWYDLDTGHLREGDRADVLIIDPARLDESLEAYAENPIPEFDNLSRMVNRNDDTVTAVLVNGEYVFGLGEKAAGLGKERTGEFLRAGRR